MSDSPDTGLEDAGLELERAGVGVADCWNRIGVYGDASCAELQRHIHCRNCPIYSTAAVEVLAAELPSDYRARGAIEIGRPKAVEALDTHSVVVFRLGSEWLALPTPVLKEIVSLCPIHSVPHRNGMLLGIANIRGELLVCFSLSKVLGLLGAAEDQALKFAGGQALKTRVTQRLLVIEYGGQRGVCPVDEVSGIVRYRLGDLVSLPATVAKAGASYTRALLPWADKSVGILDEELLLHMVNRNMA